MTDAGPDRWSEARQQLIVRWRAILERIDARDEGGVLSLANVMDEFCEEAIAERDEAGAGRSESPQFAHAPMRSAGGIGERCLFCRGFVELGGCLGALEALDTAVTRGDWKQARGVASRYLDRLEAQAAPVEPGSGAA